MLFKILKVDENSKKTAFRVAVFNLFLTFLLTILLFGFGAIIFTQYDELTAQHVSRLIWVEVVLNLLFFPFAIVLAVGIKKEKYKLIRMWIKMKVVQASYIFLVNLVVQIYISVFLNVGHGIVVLVYTIVVEVFYMENIMYMNSFYRYQQSEDKTVDLEKSLPSDFIIKF